MDVNADHGIGRDSSSNLPDLGVNDETNQSIDDEDINPLTVIRGE